MEYNFELDRIIAEILKRKAKVIGLQFPEGLNEQAMSIEKYLE